MLQCRHVVSMRPTSASRCVGMDSTKRSAASLPKRKKKKKHKKNRQTGKYCVGVVLLATSEPGSLAAAPAEHKAHDPVLGAPAKNTPPAVPSSPSSSATSSNPLLGGGPGVPYTVSIALPGSIVANAQSAELRTYLAGQIARAAAVFNVSEVVHSQFSLSVAKLNVSLCSPRSLCSAKTDPKPR